MSEDQTINLPEVVEAMKVADAALKTVLFRTYALTAAKIQRGELNLAGKQSALSSKPSGLTTEQLNLLNQINQLSFQLTGAFEVYAANFSESKLLVP